MRKSWEPVGLFLSRRQSNEKLPAIPEGCNLGSFGISVGEIPSRTGRENLRAAFSATQIEWLKSLLKDENPSGRTKCSELIKSRSEKKQSGLEQRPLTQVCYEMSPSF